MRTAEGPCVHLVVRVHILLGVRTFSRPCAHFAGRVHFCKAVRTFSRPCAHFAGRVHILPAVWMFTFSPNVHVLNVRTVTCYLAEDRTHMNCTLLKSARAEGRRRIYVVADDAKYLPG